MQEDLAFSIEAPRPGLPEIAPVRQANLMIMPTLDAAQTIAIQPDLKALGEGPGDGPAMLGVAQARPYRTPSTTGAAW